jgi:hypothetical protein
MYILKFFEDINSQINCCKRDKNAVKNIINKISNFNEFDINMKAFLHDKIYGKETSDEIVDY